MGSRGGLFVKIQSAPDHRCGDFSRQSSGFVLAGSHFGKIGLFWSDLQTNLCFPSGRFVETRRVFFSFGIVFGFRRPRDIEK